MAIPFSAAWRFDPGDWITAVCRLELWQEKRQKTTRGCVTNESDPLNKPMYGVSLRSSKIHVFSTFLRRSSKIIKNGFLGRELCPLWIELWVAATSPHFLGWDSWEPWRTQAIRIESLVFAWHILVACTTCLSSNNHLSTITRSYYHVLL